MKKAFFKRSMVAILIFSLALVAVNLSGPSTVYAATAPSLGTSSSFAVLAGSGITSTNPPQVIVGDAGSNPTVSNGLTGAEVTGTNYTAADAAVIAAKVAAASAYANASTQPQLGADIATELAAQTLTPGVYHAGSLAISGAGTLTLDGGGDSNAVFIFKADTTLITGGASSVVLTNGAQARNVFWTVGTSATLNNTTFVGTIMAEASITDSGNSTIVGRLLADAENNGTGAVTLNNTHITVPTTLTLGKVVVNNSGGSATSTDWTLAATGPISISGVTGNVNVTNATVTPGTYILSESAGPAGYASSTYSCIKNGGVAVAGNSITLAAGDEATCTITNDDVAPTTATLTLVKTIVGGTRTFADFPLTATGATTTITGVYPAVAITNAVVNAGTYTLSEITKSDYTAETWSCTKNPGAIVTTGPSITLASGDSAICTIQNTFITPSSGGGGWSGSAIVPPLIDVVKVPSPLALPAGPGAVTYAYTLRNIGTVPVTDITMVDDSCSPAFVSGDTNSDSKLDVAETWTYSCAKTLSATHTNIVTATGWANGISATDITSATVVVGIPVVPPLIHVTKVPSPLALPAGGGMVTYTKKVTNPGTVALSNVRLTDDKCADVKYISGDTNGDSKLDPAETWTYTCQSKLTRTTTNTAVVRGDANGLTATDFAIATVVVAPTAVATVVPKLPDTGIPSSTQNIMLGIIIGLGFLTFASVLVVRKLKKT